MMARRSLSSRAVSSRRGSMPLFFSSMGVLWMSVACGGEDEPSGPPEYGGPVPGASASSSNVGAAGVPVASGAVGSPPRPEAPVNLPLDNDVSGSAGAGGSPNTLGQNGGNGMVIGAAGNAGASSSQEPPPVDVDPEGDSEPDPEQDPEPPPPPAPPPAAPPPPAPPPPAPPPPAPPPPPPPAIDTDCPAGAFFCAGFEGAAFPAGTNNIIGGAPFNDAFLLDDGDSVSGEQSLLLPATTPSNFAYRVMAIPVPVQAFWARMFVRFDLNFGDGNHDALWAISSGGIAVDNNNETRIEFAEQEGTIVLNRSTDVIGFPIARPATLPGNVWHCMETRFDGAAGDVEVFANGQAIVRDVGQAKYRFTVQTFRIGYIRFNTAREVRFDDVVLSPNRVGCD